MNKSVISKQLNFYVHPPPSPALIFHQFQFSVIFTQWQKKVFTYVDKKPAGEEGKNNIKSLSNHFSAYFQCKSFPFTHCAVLNRSWTLNRAEEEFRWVFFIFFYDGTRRVEEKFGNKHKNLDKALSSSSLVECVWMWVCHYDVNRIKSHKIDEH